MEQPVKNEKPIDPDLIWFGIRADTGRPILERVDTNRCTECKGFGTYGNPLCGALYYCKQCKGTGHNPKFTQRPFIQKIISIFKRIFLTGE